MLAACVCVRVCVCVCVPGDPREARTENRELHDVHIVLWYRGARDGHDEDGSGVFLIDAINAAMLQRWGDLCQDQIRQFSTSHCQCNRATVCLHVCMACPISMSIWISEFRSHAQTSVVSCKCRWPQALSQRLGRRVRPVRVLHSVEWYSLLHSLPVSFHSVFTRLCHSLPTAALYTVSTPLAKATTPDLMEYGWRSSRECVHPASLWHCGTFAHKFSRRCNSRCDA